MNTRKVKQRSKPMSFKHVVAACGAFDNMDKAGIPENLAIRSLEVVVNGFSNVFNSDANVHVSIAAAKSQPSETIEEHSSPKREYTRLFIKAYREGKLNEASAIAMAKKYWAVALITKEEDQRLRMLGLRSKLMETPHDRWTAAGITFT